MRGRPSSLVWRAHVLTTTEEEKEEAEAEEGPLLEITAFESKAHAKNDYFHVGKRGEMAPARARCQQQRAAGREGGPCMYARHGEEGRMFKETSHNKERSLSAFVTVTPLFQGRHRKDCHGCVMKEVCKEESCKMAPPLDRQPCRAEIYTCAAIQGLPLQEGGYSGQSESNFEKNTLVFPGQ